MKARHTVAIVVAVIGALGVVLGAVLSRPTLLETPGTIMQNSPNISASAVTTSPITFSTPVPTIAANDPSMPPSFVNCTNVPTTPDEVRIALHFNSDVEIGSPQASCPGGKPGGWLIDPNHRGVTATLQPGMCVDFDGRSTNFSNENALGWTDPTNWRNVTPVRAFIVQVTMVTTEGMTVYWSPCEHQQP